MPVMHDFISRAVDEPHFYLPNSSCTSRVLQIMRIARRLYALVLDLVGKKDLRLSRLYYKFV